MPRAAVRTFRVRRFEAAVAVRVVGGRDRDPLHGSAVMRASRLG